VTAEAFPPVRTRNPLVVVTALGVCQILGWGSTFYLPAVLAPAIVRDTGWPLSWVISGASLGLLVAGLISPRVGTTVARYGGRPVLLVSSLLTGSGLAALGAAPNLPFHVAAWILIGAGMGTGLYDAVFAALGRLYGTEARRPITNLTLFGGFASTVCWPLSAFIVANSGWRSACFVYAALHLCLALPLHLFAFQHEKAATDPRPDSDAAGQKATRVAAASQLSGNERAMFWLLAAIQMLAQLVGTIVIVHLLVFLQARGLEFALAVSLGTLFGPAQVGARVIERVFGHNYHPIWTMMFAALMMFAGLALVLVGFPVLAVAVVIYGAGYGVTWIARGTLPLALFGAERYPVLMGRLAMPSLIAQAVAPSAGALLISYGSVDLALAVLTAGAAFNMLVVIGLLRVSGMPVRPVPAS
jgi:MFS family permease